MARAAAVLAACRGLQPSWRPGRERAAGRLNGGGCSNLAGAGTLPGSAGCFGEQAIAGGFLNTATGDLSSISGGQQNTVNGISATVIGCSHITLTGDYKTNNTCP